MNAATDRIGKKALRLINDENTQLFISDVSVWEICLKYTAKQLHLDQPPRLWIQHQIKYWHLSTLNITPDILFRTCELPLYHKDPFDRVLIAQAITEGMTILTPDEVIKAYPVATLW